MRNSTLKKCGHDEPQGAILYHIKKLKRNYLQILILNIHPALLFLSSSDLALFATNRQTEAATCKQIERTSREMMTALCSQSANEVLMVKERHNKKTKNNLNLITCGGASDDPQRESVPKSFLKLFLEYKRAPKKF